MTFTPKLDDLAHGSMLAAAVVIAAAVALESVPAAAQPALPGAYDDTLAAAVLIYPLPAAPRGTRRS
ncbi:MAG: hypothetical protein JSR18_08675 [Proteobacteria bacterium]|nr:hypothetical protein [Pseudomonadota bacterium]